MRRRAGLVVAAVVAAAALGGMLVLLTTRDRGGSAGAGFSLGATSPAAAPFAEFREARVAVGNHCLRVLVASTAAQRVEGLRAVRSLAPYDGMLFVNPSDTRSAFTMAQTPLPLDIAWYGVDGAPVDRTTMTPCPEGTDARCPVYQSRTRYRYALETPAGAGGAGALAACA